MPHKATIIMEASNTAVCLFDSGVVPLGSVEGIFVAQWEAILEKVEM